MYIFGITIPTNRFCFRCHSRVYHSDVKGYPYVCKKCDENMFRLETYSKRERKMYVNPIAFAIDMKKNRNGEI